MEPNIEVGWLRQDALGGHSLRFSMCGPGAVIVELFRQMQPPPAAPEPRTPHPMAIDRTLFADQLIGLLEIAVQDDEVRRKLMHKRFRGNNPVERLQRVIDTFPPPEHSWDDWVDHDGSRTCPVPDDTYIEIRYEGEQTTLKVEHPQNLLRWEAISAYRVRLV